MWHWDKIDLLNQFLHHVLIAYYTFYTGFYGFNIKQYNLLSFSAGTMIATCVSKLIPESSKKHKIASILFFNKIFYFLNK